MDVDQKLLEGAMDRMLDLGVLAQGLGFAFCMMLCYQRATV